MLYRLQIIQNISKNTNDIKTFFRQKLYDIEKYILHSYSLDFTVTSKRPLKIVLNYFNQNLPFYYIFLWLTSERFQNTTKLASSALCYRDINIQIRHAVGVELKPILHWQILVCTHVFLYSAKNPLTTEDKIQAQTESADTKPKLRKS